MRPADGRVQFGEYLPDLPTDSNPGVTDISNLLWYDGAYRPFLNLNGQGYADALSARPIGAFIGQDVTGLAGRLFAATPTTLQQLAATGSTWSDRTPGGYGSVTDYVRFAQFDNFVIATSQDNFPQRFDMSLAVNFTTLASSGTAPQAKQIAVIGRFVLLGDTESGASGSGMNHLQWCDIDDPTSWTTPGTAAATTVQAGEQYLPSELGQIRGLTGGDQFGIVLQVGGLTRVTYAGPPLVFQFDTYERGRGCYFPNATVQIGGLTYYVTRDGFFVTDGVAVIDIGDQKVNRTFAADVSATNYRRMYGGADLARGLIYWAYPNASATGGRPNRLLIYNYVDKRWTKAAPDIEAEVLLTGRIRNDLSNPTLHAFSETFVPGYYRGDTELPAYITGGDIELNPGARTTVQGVKPEVNAVGSDPGTIAIAARNSLQESVSFSAESTPHARTGFAAFRSDGRYHRARWTATGAFNSIKGLEYQAVQSGSA